MCGIAGFAGFNDDILLRKMCAIIAHRGPDDDGFFTEPGVSLGMRRLSIIDLETGKQPITNEDGSVVIVYNGEIYNYRELRQGLMTRGHRLATATDTECIAHLYEEKGDDCVLSLNGMFAFALWDRKRKRLLVARDRLGIKPLSYMPVPGGVLFGSEIKSLLQHQAASPSLDPQALHDYLTWMYVPAPRSIYRGIFKLLPGHLMTFSEDEGLKTRQYWDLPEPQESGLGEEALVEQLDSVLSAAVARQMVSDVPVGAYLSGGLDSSLITALMTRHSSGPVKTFSIGYGDRARLYDELPYARQVASAFSTEHHELIALPRVVDLIDRIAWHFDEPFANSSAIPAYLISKEARGTVKVMLSGAGGDELFAGYPRNIAARWLGTYARLPLWVRRSIDAMVSHIPESSEGRHGVRRIREFARGALLDGPEAYLRWVAFNDEAEKLRLYSPAMAREVRGNDSFKSFAKYVDHREGGEYLDRMLHLDMKTWLPFNILEYSDKMSMMASIESRVPLLDNELVDLAATIPQGMKVRRGTGKYLLKKVAERYLPREIIYRKKKGFMVPIGIWIREDLKEMIHDLLSESVIRQRGYFNTSEVSRVLKDHFDGRRDYSHHIWMLLMLEVWHRTCLPAEAGSRAHSAGGQILSSR